MSNHKPMGDGMTIIAGLTLPFGAIFVFGFALRFVSDHPWLTLAIVIGVPVAAFLAVMTWIAVSTGRDLRDGPPPTDLEAQARAVWLKGRRPGDEAAEAAEIEARPPRRFVVPVLAFPDVAEGGGVIQWIERPEPASADAPAPPQGPADWSPPPDVQWLGTGGYYCIAGRHPDGRGADFKLYIDLSESLGEEVPATEAQVAAFKRFYGGAPSDLTFNQAHVGLCYRDYALEVRDSFGSALHPEYRDSVALGIAAFVSRRPEISRDVIRWNERRWRAGVDRSNIRATKHYQPVSAEAQRFGEALHDSTRG